MPEEEKITPDNFDWRDPMIGLSFLAPDLYQQIMSDDEEVADQAYEMFRVCWEKATDLVRYALSPIDHIDSYVEDPLTGQPISLEDLGIDRSRALGSTTSWGIFDPDYDPHTIERRKAAHEALVALMRRTQKHE